MARFRTPPAAVVALGAPTELNDGRAVVWQSADACRVWLEDHRLRRRMRDASDLEQMTSEERRGLALRLWQERQG